MVDDQHKKKIKLSIDELMGTISALFFYRRLCNFIFDLYFIN